MSLKLSFDPIRRQVTLLFCDVVNYAARSEALDPEVLADEIRALHLLCGDIAKKYHGRIVNYLGDGLLVVFGHPQASEFDVRHAICAGLEMVERVQRSATRNADLQPLALRVGIATGLVIIGDRAGQERDREELIFGKTPNLAARLQDLAGINRVVVAPRTRRLAGRAFKFRDLGERQIKGFAQPLQIWQVLYERKHFHLSIAASQQTASRFVGRTAELQTLVANYRRLRYGDARIIHIIGEPGIGKSRLLRKFEKSLPLGSMNHLRIRCLPYFASSPLQPIIAVARRYLGISHCHAPRVIGKRIDAAMRTIGLAESPEHALFRQLLQSPADLLSDAATPDAARKRQRSADALAKVLIRLSRLHPLLLLVEDLHWADLATLKVLERIVRTSHSENLCAVFTTRPNTPLAWADSERVKVLQLTGLSARAASQLIRIVTLHAPLPKRLIQTLVRKSSGIPLFLEETGRHLSARLKDQIKDADAQLEFLIPDTLQDFLNAKLDQLGENRHLVQLAATFGGAFSYSQLSKLARQNALHADPGLAQLLEIGIFTSIGGKLENRYQFRHALFQHTAYATLLKKTRHAYHLQIAELLQNENADPANPYSEALAWHYARAGLSAQAVELWIRAGLPAQAVTLWISTDKSKPSPNN